MSPPAATGEQFRELMRLFPTGVVAVTALDDDAPVGFVVGSFFSVSLRPVMVGFCVHTTSTSWPRIRQAARFGVNLLSAEQAAVGAALAVSGGDKFTGVAWHLSPGALPVLDGALAFLECVSCAEHSAGDHVIVVAQVSAMQKLRYGDPLIFYRHAYHTIAPRR